MTVSWFNFSLCPVLVSSFPRVLEKALLEHKPQTQESASHRNQPAIISKVGSISSYIFLNITKMSLRKKNSFAFLAHFGHSLYRY